MNQKNAEAKGRVDGQAYQRQKRSVADIYGDSSYFLSKDEYGRQGKIQAQSLARSKKTQELYIKGWNNAWEGD